VHQDTLGTTQLESSLAGRDPGVLVDTELSQQRASTVPLPSRWLGGCIQQSTASRSKERILPRGSAPVRPQLEQGVQFWAPHYNTGMDILERVQQRTTKMISGLEHLTYEERLRDLGLFSLEKRRLGGILAMCICV